MTNLRGFGYKNEDVSLTNYFALGEKVKSNYAEFFNLWNAHTFSNPGSWGSSGFVNDISSPDFGIWDGSVSDPRNGQVVAHLILNFPRRRKGSDSKPKRRRIQWHKKQPYFFGVNDGEWFSFARV